MSVPTFKENINGEVVNYWNCPVNFIPKNILQFIGLYDYVKRFEMKMPEFKKVSKRFLQAVNYYESIVANPVFGE